MLVTDMATVTVTAAGLSPIINKERGSVVYKVVKRLFDIGISFLLLIILMVPMIVIFLQYLFQQKGHQFLSKRDLA